jgi:hypothetical protein
MGKVFFVRAKLVAKYVSNDAIEAQALRLISSRALCPCHAISSERGKLKLARERLVIRFDATVFSVKCAMKSPSPARAATSSHPKSSFKVFKMSLTQRSTLE